MSGLIVRSALLGVGLAMDAFSVSVANGLRAPNMRRAEQLRIAGCFAFFQWLMPLMGWLGVHVVERVFTAATRAVPWIGFGLLAFIGGKMLLEGLRGEPQTEASALTPGALLVQGVATSIDALSAGFALAEETLPQALASAFIIAGVTFALCLLGVRAGQKAGQRLTRWASVLGGLILIGIGIRIIWQAVL